MTEDRKALTKQLNIRVSLEDLERLNAIRGPISRSLVAREAMRRGLALFEEKPALVLDIPPVSPGPKPRKAADE
tara:strand:- start:4064 stop:4285 length:222 start_codon:yes stop_codon:yes gene_type:complete